MYVDSKTAMRFQSTHPVRGATRAELLARNEYVFQSTHPVRGATDMFSRPAIATHFNPRTP